jgi:hypothetical protein
MPATPATPATPAPTEVAVKPPPPEGSCDVTGTWRLKLVSLDSECIAAQDVLIDLAIASGPANTVVGKLQAVGSVGVFAPMMSALRVTPYSAPGTKCGLRLELGARTGTHAQILLGRERVGLGGRVGLDGLVALWVTGAAPCQDHGSVFGEYIATQPAPWSALTPAGSWPKLPDAQPASAELTAATRKITAKSIFGGAPAEDPRIKLRGSIVDYVAAVVETPGAVRLYEVPCTATTDGRCVAVVGDPCRPGIHEGEDCEGMYLTVVVNTTTGTLDRADSGGYPVESQADIEKRNDDAP